MVALRPRKWLHHDRSAGPAGGDNGQPLRVSLSWPNRLSPVYFTFGGKLQPTKYNLRSRNRTHLRICRTLYNGCGKSPFRYPLGDIVEFFRLWAANSFCSNFTFGDRCAHGPLERQSSTRGRNYSNRFTGYHLKAQRTRHYRSGSLSTCRSSRRYQSHGRTAISPLEIPRDPQDVIFPFLLSGQGLTLRIPALGERVFYIR